MSNLLFSIVIPTYNRANFIAKTIKSLLAQTYTNFEIIVVDDGSIDNTDEVVKSIEDDRIRYYKKENAERGAARNFGLKKAKGDYINFFDSDDIAYPNHLEVASRLIKTNKFSEVFVLNHDIKNTENQIIRNGVVFKNINQQLIDGNLLGCNGVFVKREIAMKHSFSEIRELSASEDYLLWLQLASQFNFYYSNIKTSSIIEHDARSVLNITPISLIKRKELMLKLALEDQNITKTYKTKLNRLQTNTYSYVALHLAIADYKRESITYLIQSLKASPFFIFKKRFFAILKYLIFFNPK